MKSCLSEDTYLAVLLEDNEKWTASGGISKVDFVAAIIRSHAASRFRERENAKPSRSVF